ncbi:MAG: CPBP family intramembrane metalloprotease [Xanthomonadales bacterium]|nr:CPBP family intramembrane metalloprotease [Xanthomonadales bacterium]
MAARINQKNQQKRLEIEQGVHQFSTATLAVAQIVGSFQKDWVDSEKGVVSVKPDPELSLELNGFLIVPRLHQNIIITANSAPSSNEVSFRLELSNQKEQVYFHSNEFGIDQLNRPLDLAKVPWQVMTELDDSVVQNHQPWQNIGSFDALVIRFFGTDMVHLQQITILQSEAKSFDGNIFQTCKVRTFACFNNNAKNNLELKWNYAKGMSLVIYEQMASIEPLWWLIFSALTTCLIVTYRTVARINMVGLIVLVYVSIAVLQQNWLVLYLEWVKWMLLFVVLLLLWHYREAFFKTQGKALSVYLVSFGLALLLVLVTQKTPDFLAGLPGYFIWALVQQMILGPIFTDFFKVNSKASNVEIALLVGVLFSAIHAPNHTLMAATLLGGFVWSYVWLKYRNVYANAFSHAVLALTFYAVMPPQWLGSARIGVFF